MIQCPKCGGMFISSDPKKNRGNLIIEVCGVCPEKK